MIITCGPENSKRTITLSLPEQKSKIGVFVSGGLDSAILYYLIQLENKNTGSIHEIVPLSIMRKEGSKYFSNLVVAHVHGQLGLPIVDHTIIGDNTLFEYEQVGSGVRQAFAQGFDQVYLGIIYQLEIHMEGWSPIPYKVTDKLRAPFRKLTKSHIVDLVRSYKQEALYYITHSCSIHEVGRCNTCNGCKERAWGFEQLNIADPSII